VATIQTVRVFKIVQAFAGRLVARIHQPAARLQENCRTQITFAVPPVARASGRATGTENAFVQSIELVAVFRRLSSGSTAARNERRTFRSDAASICRIFSAISSISSAFCRIALSSRPISICWFFAFL
jgi:hypothetical protein